MITKHPYIATIYSSYETSIEDDGQGYKAILTVQCDVEKIEVTKETEVYESTHKLWWWLDSMVIFDGNVYTWKEYSRLAGRKAIKVGDHVKVDVYGYEISGAIKFFNPSQMGVEVGIDINEMW